MSLFVGLRRDEPVAGIVGFSGRLLAPDLLDEELRARPPILLVHGTDDPLVPYASLAEAEAALKALDVPVETVTSAGIGHSIDNEGAAAGRSVSPKRAQRDEALTTPSPEGSVENRHLGRIPLCGALDPAQHLACRDR